LEFQNRRVPQNSEIVMPTPYNNPSTIAPTKAKAT